VTSLSDLGEREGRERDRKRRIDEKEGEEGRGKDGGKEWRGERGNEWRKERKREVSRHERRNG
jgi:hypothetical protein